jgi:thiamine pyrophosphate-dependent acetolactate synthase large subunit-like protein
MTPSAAIARFLELAGTDIQATPVTLGAVPDPRGWTRVFPPAPAPAAVEEAAALLAGARRPLIVVSTGIHNTRAWKAVEALADEFTLPGCTTLAAKGAFPEDHRCYVGIPGRFGDEHSVKAARAGDGPPLDYAPLFEETAAAIREVDPETSVLFDTGQTLCYAPSFFRAASRHVHTNNGHFIRMGWSVPALIGSKLAHPDHPALAFTGAGSFMMTGTAVATAVGTPTWSPSPSRWARAGSASASAARSVAPSPRRCAPRARSSSTSRWT